MLQPLRTPGRRLSLLFVSGLFFFAASPSGAPVPVFEQGGAMSVEQVMAMPKIDAHAHLGALRPEQLRAFVAFLERTNFRWLTICTGGMSGSRLQQQIASAQEIHRAYPSRVAWATSFSLENWGQADWARAANATIDDGFAQGAVAVKVWKDVGMVLQDPDGRYVMIDDPRMDDVLGPLEKRGRPLVAHLGEPRNCWLPLDQMTTASDRRYFANHPQYHGLLQPQIPDYARQIAARDTMLERHPSLKVIGCHLASLEYDVDEVARRLDKHPNLAVDLAARIVHLQIQPREKVRAFILKYQDRILYGTDLQFGGGAGQAAGSDPAPALARMLAEYESDAAWLATDQDVPVERAREGFASKGLSLPAEVLRKIYYENARRWYPGL
ncbi:MAG TPA: amidohydrolase family protein [Vicinamibacterales bacterium]|nr:amidohydrolase family protein [Vicinamibacterales bacterium]